MLTVRCLCTTSQITLFMVLNARRRIRRSAGLGTEDPRSMTEYPEGSIPRFQEVSYVCLWRIELK